jgi:hypothetical protein
MVADPFVPVDGGYRLTGRSTAAGARSTLKMCCHSTAMFIFV